MAVPQYVSTLTRNDTTASWIPFNNTLHVAMPKDVQSVHMNIYSPKGLVTFWAMPNDIRGSYSPWGNNMNTYPQFQATTNFGMSTLAMQNHNSMDSRQVGQAPYYPLHTNNNSMETLAHNMYNQYFGNNEVQTTKPFYPPNRSVPENFKQYNNQHSLSNRSTSRKRARSPMPVPTSSTSSSNQKASCSKPAVSQVQWPGPSSSLLDREAPGALNLSAAAKAHPTTPILANLLDLSTSPITPQNLSTQSTSAVTVPAKQSPTSTSKQDDSDATLSSDSPIPCSQSSNTI